MVQTFYRKAAVLSRLCSISMCSFANFAFDCVFLLDMLTNKTLKSCALKKIA